MNEEAIQDWFIARLSKALKRDPDTIGLSVSLADYGLDSMAAVAITGELEDLLQGEVSPTLLWDYPTIEQLARHLASSNVSARG